MTIGLAAIAYRNTTRYAAFLESIKTQGTPVRVYLYVNSDNPTIARLTSRFVASSDNGITARAVWNFKNKGVSQTWNDAIEAMIADGCESMVISNDDCVITPGDLEKIAETSHQPNIGLATGSGVVDGIRMDDMGLAFFAVSRAAVEEVGAFDENIFPAYWEDIDYKLRLLRSGIWAAIDPRTNVEHTKSSSIGCDWRIELQNNVTYKLNRAYFERKWGCQRTDLVVDYEYPFNDPSMHPYRIPFSTRSRPYGKYDRSDKGVVAL